MPAKLTLASLVERVKLKKIGLSTVRQSLGKISEIWFLRHRMLGWDIAEGYCVEDKYQFFTEVAGY